MAQSRPAKSKSKPGDFDGPGEVRVELVVHQHLGAALLEYFVLPEDRNVAPYIFNSSYNVIKMMKWTAGKVVKSALNQLMLLVRLPGTRVVGAGG
jgi:hypothetical protein